MVIDTRSTLLHSSLTYTVTFKSLLVLTLTYCLLHDKYIFIRIIALPATPICLQFSLLYVTICVLYVICIYVSIICIGWYMFQHIVLYIYLVYLVRLLYVITCKLCSEYLYRVYVMLCYVILWLLCYAMVGCCVVPCPKNFSAQSDPVSLCASDNKRLVTCE